MAYGHTNSKGKTYSLHAATRKLKSGKESKLYYFAKEVKEGALDGVPAGYQVVESKTGLLALKRK
jgi:hypothetical protein